MERSLIISDSEKGVAFFTEILAQNFDSVIVVAHTGSEARRLLAQQDFELCIISAPLKDEFGDQLAMTISEKYACQVILVVKAEIFDEVMEKVEDFGVITVSKPLNKTLFWNAVKLAKASRRRLQMMQKENDKLLQKIEDLRVVNQAKYLLISYLRMTEQEAHRYIEKQSMDMRMTKRQIAENILKTYDS